MNFYSGALPGALPAPHFPPNCRRHPEMTLGGPNENAGTLSTCS